MSNKYRKERLAKLNLQDNYVEGVTEDEAALEARDWHDENVPDYDGFEGDSHRDEQIPF